MAGAKLATAQGATNGSGAIATCPADESWLVYTLSLVSTDLVSLVEPKLLYTDSNTGNQVLLAVTGPVDYNGLAQCYVGPSMVMNANDTLDLSPSGPGSWDFYMSGLIQRGPGPVPS